MGEIDFGAFAAITFDTYGTLIDWESGILAAFAPALAARGLTPALAGRGLTPALAGRGLTPALAGRGLTPADDARGLTPALAARGLTPAGDDLLARYARHEARLEAGAYRSYADVLGQAFDAVCRELGVVPDDAEVAAFAASVGDWPAFADSAAALAALKTRFRLGVITNCDDALFARSNARLGVDFDWVITAEQAGSYKPSPRNFELALERIDVPPDGILHVAQSLFHDHVPAKALGLTTVWVDRRRGLDGFGATPPAQAAPDLVVPDMRSFAALALALGPG